MTTASSKFDEGASFVLLGLPKGSHFGIDCHSWVVGEKFMGIRMIPPGWHLITCCSSSARTNKSSSSVVSFAHKFSAREMHVRKWDLQMEEFDKLPVSEVEIERLRCNKAEVDCHLGPYPLEVHRKWLSLSNFLSDEVIFLIMPQCGYVYSATQFLSEKLTFSKSQRFTEPVNDIPPSDIIQAEARLPKLQQEEASAIRYSLIDRRAFEVGSTPSSISLNSIDSTYHLEQLLQNRFQNNYTLLLGEIQFAFLCFLICQNYDSFEQWKKSIELVCSCDLALLRHADLFLNFIKMFYYQLKEVPSDFFVDIVSADNFLTVTLHRFFNNVDNATGVSPPLKNRVEKFKKYVTEQFKWDFSAELAEDQPVVVDI